MTKKKKSLGRRLFGYSIALSGIVSLAFVPWVILLAWAAPLRDSIQQELDAALNHEFEGIIVYVDQQGQAPEYYAAGWHDRDQKIPAYPEAFFKIASVGKLYVAVTTAKLIAEGRLSANKSLAEYRPDLEGRVQYADRITLGMMVQHRSGIPSFTDHPTFWSDPPESKEAALDLAFDEPALFEPGDDYHYSNTNYTLIADILDQTLGYSHLEYIKNSMLAPIGATNTFGSIHEINMDELMSGYYIGVEGDIKTSDYASMVATAKDVGIFLRALNDGTLLNDEEEAIYASLYKYEHTGLIPGYQTIAEYHEELDAVVIQFVNTTDFSGYHWSLGEIVYDRIVRLVERRE